MYSIWCCLVLLCGVQYINAIFFNGQDSTSLFVSISGSSVNGMSEYTVTGRGIKDKLVERRYSSFGNFSPNIINSQQYSTAYYTDNNPFALYTDVYGTLAIVRPGGCVLRKYNGDAPPVETVLSNAICDKIKNKLTDQIKKVQEYWRKWNINFQRQMKGLPPAEIIFDPLQYQPSTPSLYAEELKGFTPSQTPTGGSGQEQLPSGNDDDDAGAASEADTEPSASSEESDEQADVTWQSGSFISTYRPTMSVSIKKNKNGPNGCTIQVSMVGRGINEKIENSCSVLGENVLKKSTVTSLAVGDPTTKSGFYTENWSGLVVILNGRCTYRSYESSPITNKTKSTPKTMTKAECATAMKRLSNALKAK